MSQFGYLILGLQAHLPWPTKEATVEFDGEMLTLRPADRALDLAPSIVVPLRKDFTENAARALARRFLSGLTWIDRAPVLEVDSVVAGHPIGIGNPARNNTITHEFDADDVPDPSAPRIRLALALFREALGVNSVPYRFLGFYKIVNMLHAAGAAQKAWINQNIDRAVQRQRDGRAAKRLAELRTRSLTLARTCITPGAVQLRMHSTIPWLIRMNPATRPGCRRIFRSPAHSRSTQSRLSSA